MSALVDAGLRIEGRAQGVADALHRSALANGFLLAVARGRALHVVPADRANVVPAPDADGPVVVVPAVIVPAAGGGS